MILASFQLAPPSQTLGPNIELELLRHFNIVVASDILPETLGILPTKRTKHPLRKLATQHEARQVSLKPCSDPEIDPHAELHLQGLSLTTALTVCQIPHEMCERNCYN